MANFKHDDEAVPIAHSVVAKTKYVPKKTKQTALDSLLQLCSENNWILKSMLFRKYCFLGIWEGVIRITKRRYGYTSDLFESEYRFESESEIDALEGAAVMALDDLADVVDEAEPLPPS